MPRAMGHRIRCDRSHTSLTIEPMVPSRTGILACPTLIKKAFYRTSAFLEFKTQGELHDARIGDALRVFSERRRLIQVIADAVYVKANAVGNIERFPAQLNAGALSDVKV